MNLEIIEKTDKYITIKIPVTNEKEKFLETEEKIAKKVNEVGKILTKDALKKLNEQEKIVKRGKEELVLKGEKKSLITHHMGA